MIGAGAALISFETDFTITRRSGTTNTDGYIMPTEEVAKTLRGTLVPWSREELEQMGHGYHEGGFAHLYVRTSQKDYDQLELDLIDKVTDPEGNDWKVTEIKDYIGHATVKILEVVRT